MGICLVLVVLTTGVTSAANKQELKCKARSGCHFSGCDPVQSLSFAILDRNEFPITCKTSEGSGMKKLSQENMKLKNDFAKFVAETEAKLKNLENQIKLLTSNRPTVGSTTPPVSSQEGIADSAPPTVATLPGVTTATSTKETSQKTTIPTSESLYLWSSWIETFCSTTCGPGVQGRNRYCVDGSSGETASRSKCTGTSYISDLSCFNECVDEPKYLTKFNCDFQTDGDLCGLTNSISNDANWIQNFGNLPQPVTGPVNLTMGDAEGYIYVDTSPENATHVFSRVMTPKLAIGKYCVKANVFVTTDGIGFLKVQVRAFAPWSALSKRPKILYSSDLTTSRWVNIEQYVSVASLYHYVRVDFEAWRSADSLNSKPAIVIDNIHINPGRC